MARILGIDYGIKRIGVAVSDPLGITAQPVSVIERTSLKEDLEKLRVLAQQFEVAKIVVGLPLNMDGTPGMLTEQVQSFSARLGEATGVAVELYDERLSTMQAERMLTEEADVSRERRRGVRDKIAASFILRSYLESKGQ